MTGKLYIDGMDAFTQFGVFVERDGYKELIQYASLKKPYFTSWPEEDGIDVDLETPVLDSKEFAINFCFTGRQTVEELIDYLSDGPYHDFDFTEIEYKAKLRMVSQPKKGIFYDLSKFSLRFIDDFPLEDYEYKAPVNIGVEQTDYDLDGKYFADYGIWILDGSDAEIEKSPAVKKNLTISVTGKAGAIYHGEEVYFEQKDVALKCGTHTPTAEIFWQNYLALLHDLIQPEERMFYSERLGEETPCYYNSCKVTKFEITRSGEVWCEFTLNLVFTNFRVGELMYLLAGEDDFLILDEEDDECFIDVKEE